MWFRISLNLSHWKTGSLVSDLDAGPSMANGCTQCGRCTAGTLASWERCRSHSNAWDETTELLFVLATSDLHQNVWIQNYILMKWIFNWTCISTAEKNYWMNHDICVFLQGCLPLNFSCIVSIKRAYKLTKLAAAAASDSSHGEQRGWLWHTQENRYSSLPSSVL